MFYLFVVFILFPTNFEWIWNIMNLIFDILLNREFSFQPLLVLATRATSGLTKSKWSLKIIPFTLHGLLDKIWLLSFHFINKFLIYLSKVSNPTLCFSWIFFGNYLWDFVKHLGCSNCISIFQCVEWSHLRKLRILESLMSYYLVLFIHNSTNEKHVALDFWGCFLKSNSSQFFFDCSNAHIQSSS